MAIARSRPGLFLRLFLMVPALCFHLGLANRMAKHHILLLTTTGRRTGRVRVAGLNFAQEGRTIYVCAGWGTGTGWYQNLLAKPVAWVQLGRRSFMVRARPVTDPAEQANACQLLSRVDGGPPQWVRPLLRLVGFDFDAERARAFADPSSLVVVALDKD